VTVPILPHFTTSYGPRFTSAILRRPYFTPMLRILRTADEDFTQTYNRVFGVPEPGSVILLLSGGLLAWMWWGGYRP